MATIDEMKAQRQASLDATKAGPPGRTTNRFFGVGPITDLTRDEVDSRRMRFEFENWLEQNYRKFDDTGRDIGAFTTAEIGRSMHRGYPADKILVDMMRQIHSYFGFPKKNKMAAGLGGGHSGFTVCILHMMNANDPAQHVFVDTPKPESDAAKAGGFFRQSWGAQMIEMQRYSKNGDENRIHFTDAEGTIPAADDLVAMGIKLFVGVGHETTGATTYTTEDISSLLSWIDRDPANHHAIIDSTSMLGAMPWPQDIVDQVMSKCCMFTPFQKAVGGISGYLVASLTPEALALIDANQTNPSWAIPRQLKLTVPEDAKHPLTSRKTTALGPIYDPQADAMQGGIINTYSTLAFAETAFGVLRSAKLIGTVEELNQRSIANRQKINEWVAKSSVIDFGVSDEARRGAAVTLLKVTDPDITDAVMHDRIIASSKQLLSYEGLTRPNGDHEPGLDVARYVNAFPGTPGDYRAWIGGIRPVADIEALLENLQYAYHRAKIVVLEEELAKGGEKFEASAPPSGGVQRHDDPGRPYKILVADLVGLRFDASGNPDHSEVRAYIEQQGGVFHEGQITDENSLERGKIHFFYQPNLSTEDELLPQTGDGQYDGIIAAATFLPKKSKFAEGGVRIGAGTGNMACECWGGGDGAGGAAPLMNTPSFNSRATAHMTLKALLKKTPDLPVDKLHDMVVDGKFDTGKNLCEFPTEKLEGKRMAVIGYGNIGREVARLAQAFGMNLVIHARERHRGWILSEGFEYAATPLEAATGADVISPHTGLGVLDAASGTFANAGLINADVLNAMNDGAVVVNYDRGEVIDAAALDAALTSGKIRYAGIDADLFVCPESGDLSGPMVPYREMECRHKGKMELLPHAAADTEHLSRVEGARQAVDQIMNCIRFHSVTNLKGDLPEGYTNAGAKTVDGVGKVTGLRLAAAAAQDDTAARMRKLTEDITAIWGAIAATDDPARRQELIDRYGSDLIASSNRYAVAMEKMGLKGPYEA